MKSIKIYHSNYHWSVGLSDNGFKSYLEQLKCEVRMQVNTKDPSSGNSKNTEESFGHKVEQQEITTRKDCWTVEPYLLKLWEVACW